MPLTTGAAMFYLIATGAAASIIYSYATDATLRRWLLLRYEALIGRAQEVGDQAAGFRNALGEISNELRGNDTNNTPLMGDIKLAVAAGTNTYTAAQRTVIDAERFLQDAALGPTAQEREYIETHQGNPYMMYDEKKMPVLDEEKKQSTQSEPVPLSKSLSEELPPKEMVSKMIDMSKPIIPSSLRNPLKPRKQAELISKVHSATP